MKRMMRGIQERLRSPLVLGYLMGPVGLGIVWALRDLHLIAHLAWWLYAALFLGPMIPSLATNHFYAKHKSRVSLHTRAATDALASTLAIYATGWGPALGMGYLVAAEHLAATSSPSSWRVSRLWALIGIAGGQVAIAVGWFPSFIRSPADNGVAVLGAVVFVLVSRMAMTIAADRERAWERLRSLLSSSSDMIVVFNGEGKAILASGACERITGYTAEELKQTNLSLLIHPADRERVIAYLREALTRPEPTRPVDIRIQHRDGGWRHLEAVGTNHKDNPAIGGVVMNVRDVTDRKRAETRLAHSASHDSLTGLPNRVEFLSRLDARLARTAAQEQPAVLFLDVDRFKLINDSLGHDIGDTLLIEAASRLRAVVRGQDTVARFGGDEFVIMCQAPTDAISLARRLLHAFDQPFRLGGEDYYLSASVGVAMPQEDATSSSDLIRDADTAMYRAKEQGRGRLQVFDDETREAALSRAHTEHLLRGAVDRGELELFYQPIVDVRTEQVVATEALLRWHHPKRGLIGPVEFIDTAEDSGLILPIGQWVMRQACQQAVTWAARGESINMSINVSARQLADESVARTLGEILQSGRDILSLTLEITESALIRDPVTASEGLHALKALGVDLAMDDFGTGYSSLANLRRYPFDVIKIDRRFVAGLTESEDDGTIVRTIINLAHNLGRNVVAEGVETEQQFAALRDLGCDHAQGFYLGAPRQAAALPSMLLCSGSSPSGGERQDGQPLTRVALVS